MDPVTERFMPERFDRAGVSRPVHRVDEEASLGHLALVLAHRLRGLVAGIEGYTDLLIDSLPTREQRDLAFRILESTVRIERILADLQRYSEPVEPVFSRVGLRDVLENLLAAVDEADLERIRFEVPPHGHLFFMADPVLLRQALLVLLQNALDATRSGGDVRFRVIPDPPNEVIRFEVHNDGRIDEEEAESKVFMPFFTTKAHNLGVGLCIGRRIAEAHGGRLELAANGAESGICFVLTLPLAGPGTEGNRSGLRPGSA
ncbi:sensor histidine kinase [Rhodocaloribacter litoris]|uniref:sensor histidine kinase n=1 Tax=Rhodocaloribacter litoris TaxID=2558931 RepID=UPI001E580AE0|nr:HAMP domain-containing sensor histidine kinase [Rhodocaloribacter litoris]